MTFIDVKKKTNFEGQCLVLTIAWFKLQIYAQNSSEIFPHQKTNSPWNNRINPLRINQFSINGINSPKTYSDKQTQRQRYDREQIISDLSDKWNSFRHHFIRSKQIVQQGYAVISHQNYLKN